MPLARCSPAAWRGGTEPFYRGAADRTLALNDGGRGRWDRRQASQGNPGERAMSKLSGKWQVELKIISGEVKPELKLIWKLYKKTRCF